MTVNQKHVIPNCYATFTRTCYKCGFGICKTIKYKTMTEKGYVYFMTNKANSVLYIGVTSDLQKRVNQHKNHDYEGFSDKYNCEKLVYFEECDDIKAAIAREKQLKNWHREWKNSLVDKTNPEWKDLSL